MSSRKSPLAIGLEPAEKAALEHLVRSPTTLNGLAERARIILYLAAGMSITQTTRQVGVHWTTKSVAKVLADAVPASA